VQLSFGWLSGVEKLPNLLASCSSTGNSRMLLHIDEIWDQALLVEIEIGRRSADLVDIQVFHTALALALKEVVFELLLTDK
jgi:hypothetical protein